MARYNPIDNYLGHRGWSNTLVRRYLLDCGVGGTEVQKYMTITALFLTAALTTSAFSIPAYACGSASRETNPEVLVKNAETIVRATAAGYADPPRDGSWIRFIEFRVEEVLRGENVPNTFLIRASSQRRMTTMTAPCRMTMYVPWGVMEAARLAIISKAQSSFSSSSGMRRILGNGGT